MGADNTFGEENFNPSPENKPQITIQRDSSNTGFVILNNNFPVKLNSRMEVFLIQAVYDYLKQEKACLEFLNTIKYDQK